MKTIKKKIEYLAEELMGDLYDLVPIFITLENECWSDVYDIKKLAGEIDDKKKLEEIYEVLKEYRSSAEEATKELKQLKDKYEKSLLVSGRVVRAILYAEGIIDE